MIKNIPPGSYDFREEAVRLIKLSRYGLRGDDRRELVKRASPDLVDAIAKLELHPGEVPIHLLAFGTTEKLGANRNADGFREPTCRRDHPTFVKRARFYREHSNKDVHKSYGRVVYSTFNEPMARVELIATLNSNKEAADRNHSLVADREMEAIEGGREIPVSMATSVPYDVCSGCGNRARTRAEYCGERVCTKYGGLRNNLGRTFEDGHHLHADNPVNDWFDISHVARGADRIAFVLGRLDKAASAIIKGGAELADELGLTAPAGLLGGLLPAAQAKTASALAAACSTTIHPAMLLAFAPEVCPAPPELTRRDGDKVASALVGLAALGGVLSLPDFLSVALGHGPATKAAASAVAPFLPGAYAELASGASMVGPFADASPISSAWCRQAAEGSRLDAVSVAKRAASAAIRRRDVSVPDAGKPRVLGRGPSEAVAAVARQYALYKIAALAPHASGPDWPQLISAAAAQDVAAALFC